MSERASYTRIGAFVVVGTLLFATGLAVFGSGLLQRGGIVAETYFQESVLGLNLGAAVYERGVKVGEVIDIDFVRTVYEIPPDDARFDVAGSWVVVRFRLRPPRGSYLRTGSRVFLFVGPDGRPYSIVASGGANPDFRAWADALSDSIEFVDSGR